MPKNLYLDQNAWIALAGGAWDKAAFPNEHAVLAAIIECVRAGSIVVPLSFSNIYETAKINNSKRRVNLARTQSILSGGRVFRGRRRILEDSLKSHLAHHQGISHRAPALGWYLSDLWFEAAADYRPETYGFEISETVLELIRKNPAESLFHFLARSDDRIRIEAVRQYSSGSAALVAAIEARRTIVAGEPLAMRRRAYGARLVIDEIELILRTGRLLGLDWRDVQDIGSAFLRSLVREIPILYAECELVVRLEDLARPVMENDLRDMAAFSVTLPHADIVVGEKLFVNLAWQSGLDRRFRTKLLSSIFDLVDNLPQT